MAEVVCGHFKADYPEDYKECFNEMLQGTVEDAEIFIYEMADSKFFIEMAETKCGDRSRRDYLAREVIKKLNKAMIK